MKYLGIMSAMVVLTLGAYWARVAYSRQSNDIQRQVLQTDLLAPTADGPVTIDTLAKRAKAKGLSKVYYPEGMARREYVRDLDDAAAKFSIFIIKPMERVGISDRYQIATVFKVRVLNTLRLKGAAGCCTLPASDKIPPLQQPDEVYLTVSGGSVMVDGVEVVQTGELINLEIDQEYVIFGNYSEIDKAANVPLGVRGVFRLTNSGLLAPHQTGSSAGKQEVNKLQSALEVRYGSSATRFFESLRQK